MNEEETDGEYLLRLWSSFPFVWFPATASRRAACAGERARERESESALVSASAREGEGDEGGERRGVAVASLSFASSDIYRKL
jgi:hypothetical protein